MMAYQASSDAIRDGFILIFDVGPRWGQHGFLLAWAYSEHSATVTKVGSRKSSCFGHNLICGLMQALCGSPDGS